MLMDKAMLLESPPHFQHQYLIVQLVECMFFGKTWHDAMSCWQISHAEQVSGLDWFVSKSHRSDFIAKTSLRFVMYTKCFYNLGLMTLIELGLLLLLLPLSNTHIPVLRNFCLKRIDENAESQILLIDPFSSSSLASDSPVRKALKIRSLTCHMYKIT
jgi:hypothetical protein